ncbi:MAG TPA: tRNA (N6-threonylcarbamoyladenosine(37)-N6)-methyltransferase TrmO [Thermoguttaceae bacterium]|nr:tRNA (N6-threonylcarbamoyladenosine(37)-N6)-methyltransferase TrmO [Thermoguttaceae bacterium]
MRRLSMMLVGSLAVVLAFVDAVDAEENHPQQSTTFTVQAIGSVHKAEGNTRIVLDAKHAPGLLGLEGYSHIYVFWWFSKNDTPHKRAVLQVHPMGNRDNPVTGVFATRSPMRPNLIATTLCKVVSVKKNIVEVEGIDAFDGTPVLDIKPFIPGYDSTSDARLPDWLVKARKQRQL